MAKNEEYPVRADILNNWHSKKKMTVQRPNIAIYSSWGSDCPSQHQTLALYVKPLWNKPECRQWLLNGSSRATWKLLSLLKCFARPNTDSFHQSSDLNLKLMHKIKFKLDFGKFRRSSAFRAIKKTRPVKKIISFCIFERVRFLIFFLRGYEERYTFPGRPVNFPIFCQGRTVAQNNYFDSLWCAIQQSLYWAKTDM